MRGISWAAKELLACREGLGSVGLLIVWYDTYCSVQFKLFQWTVVLNLDVRIATGVTRVV